MLYLEQEIPAASQIDAQVNITSLGHFMLLTMTGDYTTKTAAGADDGICQIYSQLLDGANQRTLFENFVPVNLFLSPGRSRSIAGVGDASNQLYLELPFVYTFQQNSSIVMRLKNAAPFANTVRIAFKGVRVFDLARQSE